MARKRITVALDRDVMKYLQWQAEMGGTHVAVRVNALLRMVMDDELTRRPMVAKTFYDWVAAQDRASAFVPLDRKPS